MPESGCALVMTLIASTHNVLATAQAKAEDNVVVLDKHTAASPDTLPLKTWHPCAPVHKGLSDMCLVPKCWIVATFPQFTGQPKKKGERGKLPKRIADRYWVRHIAIKRVYKGLSRSQEEEAKVDGWLQSRKSMRPKRARLSDAEDTSDSDNAPIYTGDRTHPGASKADVRHAPGERGCTVMHIRTDLRLCLQLPAAQGATTARRICFHQVRPACGSEMRRVTARVQQVRASQTSICVIL
jgi:hypothetical protein